MILAIDASRANKKNRTGVEWYSYFLIQEFKKLIPEEIEVILYSPSPLLPDLSILPKNWSVKVLGWPPQRFWTLLRLSWEMLWHKPDALFVPSHIIPFFVPKLTFTTIHDLGFWRHPKSYPALARFIQNFGLRRALKKCEKIFTPSLFTKSELEKCSELDSEHSFSSVSNNKKCSELDSEHKIVVTELGYDGESYPPKDLRERAGEILEKYGIRKPYLLYIGRLESKKNIKNIVAGFSKYLSTEISTETNLVLAGNKGFGFDDVNLDAKNINYLGWVDQKDLPYILAEAEIFLYPSLYEGFGIPILESFASQVPVIASNRASMIEVAGGGALLVNPDSVEEISGAIERILKNELFADELRVKGLERVKNFSWQKCAKRTLEQILS